MKAFKGFGNSIKLGKILLHFRGNKEKYLSLFSKAAYIFSSLKQILPFFKKKINSFIFQVKNNPQKCIIILLTIFCVLLFIGYLKEVIDWNSFFKPKSSIYTLNSKEEIYFFKSEYSGKIKKNNISSGSPQFFSKGQVLIILDTTEIDKKIAKIEHEFPKIQGAKIVISEEIIESPDQSELVKTQILISQAESKISSLVKEVEAAKTSLDKAQHLYNQEVVTKAYLDSAENKYQEVLIKLASAESELSNLRYLYNQQSLLNQRKRIITRFQEEKKDTSFLDKWVNEKNSEIKELLSQKEKATIRSGLDMIVTESFVKDNQMIKKGDNLFKYKKLTKYGYIVLKEKDKTSLLERKAKVYYIQSGNKVLLSHWAVVNDRLQIDLKLNNIKSQKTKIIIERVKDE